MRTEKILKISLVAIVFTVALVAPILAENLGIQSLKTKFKEIYILGKGVAVNPSNSQDISIVKIGLASVIVNLADSEINVTAGVLHFGDNEYFILKDVNIGIGTLSGDIYKNNTIVGSFTLTLISKPSDNIWTGTLTINGQTYNTYILEAVRKYTKSEGKDKVAEYCSKHHENKNCREKIEDFCENNPNDARCIALIHNFCKDHLFDGRCREALRDFCYKNLSDDNCVEFCQKFPKACEPKPTTTTVNTTTTSITTTVQPTTTTQVTSTTSTTTTETTTTVETTTPSTTTVQPTTTTIGG